MITFKTCPDGIMRTPVTIEAMFTADELLAAYRLANREGMPIREFLTAAFERGLEAVREESIQPMTTAAVT